MNLKTYDFNISNIEIEVKDLKFIKELSRLFIKPHRTNFHQIVFITTEQACLRIDFQDIIIKTGQLFVIHAGQVCRFDPEYVLGGKMILFTNTFFSATVQDIIFLYTSEPFCPLGIKNPLPVNSEHTFQASIARNYLRILLLESERKMTKSRIPVFNTLVRVFCHEAERNFRENRSVQFHSDKFGVSEKKLSKEVKAITGQTSKTYITARIFLEAKRLLSYSSLSVRESVSNWALPICQISATFFSDTKKYLLRSSGGQASYRNDQFSKMTTIQPIFTLKDQNNELRIFIFKM